MLRVLADDYLETAHPQTVTFFKTVLEGLAARDRNRTRAKYPGTTPATYEDYKRYPTYDPASYLLTGGEAWDENANRVRFGITLAVPPSIPANSQLDDLNFTNMLTGCMLIQDAMPKSIRAIAVPDTRTIFILANTPSHMLHAIRTLSRNLPDLEDHMSAESFADAKRLARESHSMER